ncbi:mandelate racemase/muconate lactonizing enzyme family protein [Paenibacillus filicis]|uniref:Mandelate racemase/muconate lactonizing enzyme family protein n=1 Tax=Paenibacillus gyeongsangnamensis TaxID=3388067 RepID=A0ABT4QKD9_9BACL|nr:mandelate racemase/muconate lactonizing enzyme family protein [Paenibacillus filicis]MCZ8517337.1 mandelate racemase/muconate lactonizing enzyme family protein [Paenibacillus filicis]
MKIVDVNLFPFSAKRVYSTVTAALGGVAHKEGGYAFSDFAIIELTSDTGIKGYGEVSDIPETMTMPNGQNFTIEHLETYLANQLIGKDPFQIEELLQAYPEKNMVDIRPDGSMLDIVSCGVDNALLDLIGKTLNVPVYNLFGGKKKDKIWVSWVVYIRDIKYLEAEIAEKVKEGFDAFKLKVGIDPKQDEERLRILRETAGEKAVIKLDANSGWTFDEAVENLKRLEKYNPAGIETPIPFLDVEGKAKLKGRIGMPILEHVHTLEFALELLKHDAVDVFNISAAQAGGVFKARKILALAESAGKPCLLGSTVECGLGTASQLHLSAGSSLVTWPSDLIGPKMYVNDMLNAPHAWDQNRLLVPDGAGFGVEVDPQYLQKGI